MEGFLRFFDHIVHRVPMHFELTYSKICDWQLHIWRKGVADDGGDVEVCYIQNCDLEYVFARGQVALKDFLLETEGGY